MKLRPLACAALVLAACGGAPPEPPDAGPPDPALAVPYADARYPAVTATLVESLADDVRLYQVGSNVPGIAERRVVVVLPPGYGDAANAQRRYPVLYLGDGNNVLDSSAFGHGGWEVPQASRAAAGVTAQHVLFVCPYNGGSKRRAEYTFFHAEPGTDGATPERYLDWMQYNLMPFVDSEFRTAMDARLRGIGGSSSAAILALHAAWSRPDVYRRVVAMSTFYWDIDIFLPKVQQTTQKPPLRIYLDSGSPSDGVTEMNRIAAALTAQGFVEGQDLKTLIGENHQHNERFWRQRFPGALAFTYPLAGP